MGECYYDDYDFHGIIWHYNDILEVIEELESKAPKKNGG